MLRRFFTIFIRFLSLILAPIHRFSLLSLTRSIALIRLTLFHIYIYILNEHLFIERNKFNGIFHQHVSQHFVAVQMCSIEWMCDYDMMFLEQNEEKDWFRKKMTSSSETVWWLISKLFIRRCLIFASMHKCARFTVCVCMYVYFFVCVFFFLLSFTNALIPLSQSCYFDQPAWT